jgi:hypothetical protein
MKMNYLHQEKESIMRKLSVTLAVLAVVAFSIPVVAQTKVVKPPLKLDFGMTYSEIKSTLKDRDIKVNKAKKEKKWKLPEGFRVSKIGKYKVLDRKTDDNFAVLNADGELCAFLIRFRWTGSDSFGDADEFWESDLKKAILGKYSGEGFKEHNDPDMDGTIPELAFRDEVGNEVASYISKGTSKTLLGNINVSTITITYWNEEIILETRKQQKETDDI